MTQLRLAESLVAIADDLVTDVTLTFEREGNDGSLDMAFRDIQGFMEKVRQNEGLDSFCLRRDSSDEMEVRLGLSDHEAKEAIVGAIQTKAEKLARRMGIRLKGMESDLDAAGAVERHIKEILRVAKEMMADDDPMERDPEPRRRYRAISDASPHFMPSVYLGKLLQVLQKKELTIGEIRREIGGTQYETERGIEKLDEMRDVEIRVD
jgi:hypothetical protein